VSALVETLVTALVLSGLAACCLALLPRTPPQVRFGVAVLGLAVWLVPWGAIRIALPSSSAAAPLAEWLGAAQASALLPTETRLDAESQTAVLSVRGRNHIVSLVNLSSSGAMVRFTGEAHIGETVSLQLLDRGTIAGQVRWLRDGRMGVYFSRPLE